MLAVEVVLASVVVVGVVVVGLWVVVVVVVVVARSWNCFCFGKRKNEISVEEEDGK